jgi:hypothetical protein
MDPPSHNPRRRHLGVVPSSLSMLALKKGSTFHSPASPPSPEHDPILSVPSLPRRSPTCSKQLEATIAAGDGRIAQFLGAVDRSLSGLESFSKDSQSTILAESEPVPRFMVDTGSTNNHEDDYMDIDTHPSNLNTQPRRKHHASDSGIGSSDTSSLGDCLKPGMRQKLRLISYILTIITGPRVIPPTSTSASEGTVQTGINGNSAMTTVPGSSAQHALSEYACRQIQKHIILPIIREEKLKPFHPLVSGLPYRVARKEITCLRDLEKVLLWLAPVSSSYPNHPVSKLQSVFSRWLFAQGLEQFPNPTFNVLSSAVEDCLLCSLDALILAFCSGSDLLARNGHLRKLRSFCSAKRRSSAYTQQSIISTKATSDVQLTDLILTAIFSISLNRYDNTQQCWHPTGPGWPRIQTQPIDQGEFVRSNSEPSDRISDETLSLMGGLSQTGRPAELVRSSNGKSYSLRTGEEVNMEEFKQGNKRAVEEDLEEDILRSMARRKKSAGLGSKEEQRCKECDKLFKRPCDLT